MKTSAWEVRTMATTLACLIYSRQNAYYYYYYYYSYSLKKTDFSGKIGEKSENFSFQSLLVVFLVDLVVFSHF